METHRLHLGNKSFTSHMYTPLHFKTATLPASKACAHYSIYTSRNSTKSNVEQKPGRRLRRPTARWHVPVVTDGPHHVMQVLNQTRQDHS